MRVKITYLWGDFPTYYATSRDECKDDTDKSAFDELVRSEVRVVQMGKVTVERLPDADYRPPKPKAKAKPKAPRRRRAYDKVKELSAESRRIRRALTALVQDNTQLVNDMSATIRPGVSTLHPQGVAAVMHARAGHE